MNLHQRLWWQQARSDYDVFELLRLQGVASCHPLHYLQMACEKIAKAYFWRSGSPPPKNHAGFVQFLRFLCQAQDRGDQKRIARLFGYQRSKDFAAWVRDVLTIAYDLERLAPALASDGPNPEYPWPHARPITAPVNYEYPVWDVVKASRGRSLM